MADCLNHAATSWRGNRRISFLVESRHRMLKGSIALQVGDEIVVRDHGFVAVFGHRGEIIQILQKPFVVADRQHDRSTVAVFISEILDRLTHGLEARCCRPGCRGFTVQTEL